MCDITKKMGTNQTVVPKILNYFTKKVEIIGICDAHLIESPAEQAFSVCLYQDFRIDFR